MDYAVVVYFDKEADLFVSQIIRNICLRGVNSYMLDVGIRPHITLAGFKDTNPLEFSKWLQTYAGNLDFFNIKFSSIGAFPSNPSVLFLAPVVEDEFINLHKCFNAQIKEAASVFESHYLPGNWVPHCTLATRLSQGELHNALDVVIGDFTPFTATVTQMGLVQCNPFKEIVTYEIGKQMKV